MTVRRWHWLRRFVNAWEWACIAAIEEWFSVFARAWQTGSGAPRVSLPPMVPRVAERLDAWAPAPAMPARPSAGNATRRRAIGLATPVRTQACDTAAVAAGLVQLGAKGPRAREVAERAAQAGGDTAAVMRRALALLTEGR